MSDDRRDDAGVSLVELLVAGMIGALVLGLVGTIFVSTLQADATTRDRDLATGRIQAISTSLTTSVRNAAAVDVAALPGGGAVARARVATGGSAWECRAWAVVDLETWDAGGRRPGADGILEVRTRTYAPLSATEPAPEPLADWGVLAERVRAAGTGGASRPYFEKDGQRLTWNLVVIAAEQPQLNDEGSTAAAAGSAVARAAGGSARCW